MALELQFEMPGRGGLRASAVVVLGHHCVLEKDGPPTATTICASMGELEGQLAMLEGQIQRIREEGIAKFRRAGISS